MLGKLTPTISAPAPSASMTITVGALTPSIDGGGPPPPPPSDTTIYFVEGTPSRVSVAAFLPAGKDRYHGGWEVMASGSHNETHDVWLPGVYFDPATKEFVYDGRLMSSKIRPPVDTTPALTPNPGYFVGYESGPYNSHWPFPPTTSSTPAVANIGGVNTSQSIHGASKHTRMVYCPWDQRVYNMGGDYQAANLPTKGGGQDGRMVWWRVDPRTMAWDHYYPEWGNAGDQVPLQCDRMNFDWDPVHQVFWISHGSARMGPLGYYSNTLATLTADYPNGLPGFQFPNGRNAAWQYEAAQYSATFADAVPAKIPTPEIPLLVYDPRAITMKYACANPVLNVPWLSTANTNMQSSAFHVASRRLYNIWAGNDGVMIAWLDTTNFLTNPAAMVWQTKLVDLKAGSPDNLTGSSLHRYVAGVGNGSPCFIDEVKSLLYFLDTGTQPALLGLTLPGHGSGEHKVVLVADLSTAIGYSTGYAGYTTWPTQNRDLPGPLPGYNAGYNCPSGIGACTTSPLIWIPDADKRVVVLLLEPSEEEVGPWTRSLEISVDGGAIREGPRLPNSELDGMPWFPNAGFWYPPTEELILYGIAIMNHDRLGGNRSWDATVGGENPIPLLWQRYAWQG